MYQPRADATPPLLLARLDHFQDRKSLGKPLSNRCHRSCSQPEPQMPRYGPRGSLFCFVSTRRWRQLRLEQLQCGAERKADADVETLEPQGNASLPPMLCLP